jgi:SAM-dependent methyltransferase
MRSVRLDPGSMADRWDKEWIGYLRRAPGYLDDFSVPNDTVRRNVERVRAAVALPFDSVRGPVDPANPVWTLWAIGCRPNEIADRDVLDLGCGAGGIGRTISAVTRSYLGVDYSPLALRIAQLVSPPHCRYVVRSDSEALAAHRNSIDTAFSRSVFIHQNVQQAVELATLAAGMLRPGGLLAVDFYRPERDDHGELLKPLRPASQDLDPDQPSVSFFYTDAEIGEVGAAAGLALEAIIEAPERNWRIARFRRPAG